MRTRFVISLTVLMVFAGTLNGFAVVKIYVPHVLMNAISELANKYPDGDIEILSEDCSVKHDVKGNQSSDAEVYLLAEMRNKEHMSTKSAESYSYMISFAAGQMVLAYADKSKFSTLINRENWPYYLRKKDVLFGLVNDFSRICNVRPLLALKLSAYNYSQSSLYDTLYKRSVKFAKFEQLVDSVKKGEVDYFITYKSYAIENGLNYIELPNMASLADDCFRDKYRKTYVDLPQHDGSLKRFYGDCISFVLAVKEGSGNARDVSDFIRFILSDEARALLEKKGFDVHYSPEFKGDLKYLDGKLRGFVTYAGF
ncbi:substrate-binding domain-containing protein [Deferribacteraceae bacterium V6Fe1]|nr:substrate-binding domain-containing protein [Deferribacteraceae bacterium V6Fe1]